MAHDPDQLGGRLRLADPAALSAPQQATYNYLASSKLPWAEAAGFQARLPDGRLIGPFNAVLHAPEMGRAYNAWNDAEAEHTTLPKPVRLAVLSRESNVLWTSELEHVVQCVDGNRDLSCLTPIGGGSQTVTDDPLEAADVGLDQSPPVVASGPLPSHAAALGDDFQVTVSHCRRCLGCVARHGAGARWDDDGRLGVARGNLAEDAVLIGGAVGGERSDWTIDLVEQSADLGGVADVVGGQRRRRDQSSVGVPGLRRQP